MNRNRKVMKTFKRDWKKERKRKTRKKGARKKRLRQKIREKKREIGRDREQVIDGRQRRQHEKKNFEKGVQRARQRNEKKATPLLKLFQSKNISDSFSTESLKSGKRF